MKMVEAVAEDVTVLEAYGRLDSTTAKEFGDRLIALVQAGRNAIVIDLKNIIYISSAGFACCSSPIGPPPRRRASSRSAASPARSGGCSRSAPSWTSS